MENVGNWVLAKFTPCELPEKIATGFGQVMSSLVGVRYTPLLYAASQSLVFLCVELLLSKLRW